MKNIHSLFKLEIYMYFKKVLQTESSEIKIWLSFWSLLNIPNIGISMGTTSFSCWSLQGIAARSKNRFAKISHSSRKFFSLHFRISFAREKCENFRKIENAKFFALFTSKRIAKKKCSRKIRNYENMKIILKLAPN